MNAVADRTVTFDQFVRNGGVTVQGIRITPDSFPANVLAIEGNGYVSSLQLATWA